MSKPSKKHVLLILIAAFSFVYRIFLMLRQGFPPGADIGLHNSIVYSITQGGNTDFLWNYYHMGGGSSVTFPGYHIFTSYIILLTGMPDYMAHAFVVSLFSSFIVLVAFLITQKVWNTSAALIISFLVAVSRFDIEMLMWGGYPNVVTLMLIPLAFYLFLEKDRLKPLPFIVAASFVSAAIFLTHSLSSVMFVAIIFVTVALCFVLAKKIQVGRLSLLSWFVPIVLGALMIAPFVIQVAPAYLGSNSGTFTGGVADIRLALLSTKVLPLDMVVPLFAGMILFFLFSWRYRGKFLSVPAVLLFVWTLIPAALTQGYLVGLYTDYNRFLYFVILPVIMLITLGIDHGARFFADASQTLVGLAKNAPQIKLNKKAQQVLAYLTHKNILAVLFSVFVLVAFLAVPIFSPPTQGITTQSFYQLMDDPKYEAIQWAQSNTPKDAVFVTDAQYGWWFSGFAQRATISAVDPQYLANAREFEPAQAARYLLDTNYLIDNGLIQIREDGGHIGRHNPIFLAKLDNQYFPYPFCHLSSDEITVMLQNEGEVQIVDLAQLSLLDMHLENSSEGAMICVTYGNELFSYTQQTVVEAGKSFAVVTVGFEVLKPEVELLTLNFMFHTKGMLIEGETQAVTALVDYNMKVVCQFIFVEGQPVVTQLTKDNLAGLGLLYNLNAQDNAEICFHLGLYEYEENPNPTTPQKETSFYKELVANYTSTYLQTTEELPLEVFDYHQAVADLNASYIATRSAEQIPRFSKDPLFDLVFINNEVAIFQVRK
ncbi:MAG: hypothetical protein NWF04_00905 [Candidatus Bathyarchaeota archaeon]|nr:hypothetical protein [Candidatus Bathyarchaeota archaeon]